MFNIPSLPYLLLVLFALFSVLNAQSSTIAGLSSSTMPSITTGPTTPQSWFNTPANFTTPSSFTSIPILSTTKSSANNIIPSFAMGFIAVAINYLYL